MKREWGDQSARKVAQRLQELEAAESLADVRLLPAARCHELAGDRKGQLAVEVHSGLRLVFEPDHNPTPRHPDGGLDWERVDAVTVIEVVDYH
jgi:proteic killer suppression protein